MAGSQQDDLVDRKLRQGQRCRWSWLTGITVTVNKVATISHAHCKLLSGCGPDLQSEPGTRETERTD